MKKYFAQLALFVFSLAFLLASFPTKDVGASRQECAGGRRHEELEVLSEDASFPLTLRNLAPKMQR